MTTETKYVYAKGKSEEFIKELNELVKKYSDQGFFAKISATQGVKVEVFEPEIDTAPAVSESETKAETDEKN